MSLATLRKNVCTNIDIGTALKEIAANPHIGDELAFLTCWMVVTSSALSLTSTIMQSALILWIASVTT